MKALFSILALVLVSLSFATSAQTTLKAGDKAPDFSSKDQNGKSVSLKQFKGKKVVLYFYPRDNSSGCTAQACSLRDNISELKKQGYTVLGVSTDDEASHRGFIEKNSLPFALLADTDKSIHQKYGVWTEKERNGVKAFSTTRTTFIINKDGFINNVITQIDTKNHAGQILSLKQ
ncbi:thioredoxin-dependent thiol peroxidase [Daejeonella lutea]|uniref:thioredoxin-dependent peroxiredoxin n=1 Tax=Daejeonella lutea TaxID=572036 RepID=A0A1T5A6A5_9SPHI|nr:thioredoxin-dependent thiol peroxidase [Daejeonella lutea]SKB30468.1 peroxiredoxin Q/BCP [Daejeonella lutea]